MPQFVADLEAARALSETARRSSAEIRAAHLRVEAFCQSIRAEVARIEAGEIPGALPRYKPARRSFRSFGAERAPLARVLFEVEMSYACPKCSAAIVKPGTWFKTVSRCKCPNCQGQLRFTYEDKLAIFARHAEG